MPESIPLYPEFPDRKAEQEATLYALQRIAGVTSGMARCVSRELIQFMKKNPNSRVEELDRHIDSVIDRHVGATPPDESGPDSVERNIEAELQSWKNEIASLLLSNASPKEHIQDISKILVRIHPDVAAEFHDYLQTEAQRYDGLESEER